MIDINLATSFMNTDNLIDVILSGNEDEIVTNY